MIKSFRHKPLKQFWEAGIAARIPSELRGKIMRMLVFLENLENIKGMDASPWQLHPLKGDRKGHWALRVTGNHRITFRFAEGNVYDVDFVDYH